MDAEDRLLPSARAQILDHLGRPASRSVTGGWRSSYYILGVEIVERFVFYGTSSNLITYLTEPLGEPTASAAANLNAWSGVASVLPILGGLLADYCLGRYRTVVLASVLYLLGLSLLTLSAVLLALDLQKRNQEAYSSASPMSSQLGLFFSAIYIIALAQGCHKPCAQAFAADQFDENDPEESRSKSSFFNWWYFAMCTGTTAAFLVVNYIQDNIGWGLGFGIPGIAMAIALIIFLLGTRTYRYYTATVQIPLKPPQSKTVGSSPIPYLAKQGTEIAGQLKGILYKLFPLWATCLMYAVVWAQTTTLFTKQSSTVDGRIGKHFRVPPAALLIFISSTIVIFIPIYDQVFVPIMRKVTGLHSGITMLQRIGVGLFLAIITMVIATLVEMKRLKTASDFGLVDIPDAMIPMSLWWFIPQYVIFGIADVFTIVGWQEFFYDQVPDSLRSIGLSMYLSILGVGSFMSSLLVTVIDQITRGNGESWFADNLNHAHIDYFYCLLAALNFLGLVMYLYFASSYQYKSRGIMVI